MCLVPGWRHGAGCENIRARIRLNARDKVQADNRLQPTTAAWSRRAQSKSQDEAMRRPDRTETKAAGGSAPSPERTRALVFGAAVDSA